MSMDQLFKTHPASSLKLASRRASNQLILCDLIPLVLWQIATFQKPPEDKPAGIHFIKPPEDKPVRFAYKIICLQAKSSLHN